MFGLAVGTANAALFLAIARLPVAMAIVLQNMAPALVVLWSLLTHRRRPAATVPIALAAMIIGVAFVVDLPAAGTGQISLTGLAYGLLTAVAVASFSILGP